MTRKIEPGETDCEFCQRMKKEAPRLYRRMVRAVINLKPTRDLFLIQTGNHLGVERSKNSVPRKCCASLMVSATIRPSTKLPDAVVRIVGQ